MTRAGLAAACCTALLLTAAPAAAAPRVTLTTGFDYSSGDYGASEDTEVLVVPFQARVNLRKWRIRASLPYLKVRGPANVVVVDDGLIAAPNGAVVTRMEEEEGIGDLSLAATRAFNRLGGSDFYFDATARVRLPTGDEERGLGVGATDYVLNGELGYATRRGGFYLSAGRRFLGDRAGVVRKDGPQAGAGFWIAPVRRWTMGASYDWRASPFDTREDPAEVSAFVAYRFDEHWRLELNGGWGLSDSSPDSAVGMRLSWRTARRR